MPGACWSPESQDAVEQTWCWLRRQQQRAASAKYSPAQEAARAAAATHIRQQGAGGWWGGFASAVQGAFSGAMDAAGAHVGPGADGGTEVGLLIHGLIPQVRTQPLASRTEASFRDACSRFVRWQERCW